jgi:hypothetical protein
VIWQISNFWQLSHWQQALLTKIAIVEAAESEETVPQKTSKVMAHKVKPLSFVQVDLPSLPRLSTPAQVQKEVALEASKVEQSFKQPTKHVRHVRHVRHVADINKVSAMYQQLTSDRSIDIEIAWPNNDAERQKTFSFLYQCLGMKFGVLNWPDTNQPKVTLAKVGHAKNTTTNINSNNPVSDWLRIAQGQLAHQEQGWLKKYALSGTPVRLFPKAVDWQLAFLLTQQLHNAPLSSFRAQYKYTNQHLMLINIELNGKSLTNSWTLITRKCSI